MYEIKRLDIVSIAWITAAVSTAAYVVGAIIVGVLGFLLSGGYAYRHFWELELGNFSFFSMIGIAIIVGIASFVVGLIAALVYNWIANQWGGIKLDIVLRKEDEG